MKVMQEEDRGKHRKKRNRFIDDIAAVDEEEEEEEDEVSDIPAQALFGMTIQHHAQKPLFCCFLLLLPGQSSQKPFPWSKHNFCISQLGSLQVLAIVRNICAAYCILHLPDH